MNEMIQAQHSYECMESLILFSKLVYFFMIQFTIQLNAIITKINMILYPFNLNEIKFCVCLNSAFFTKRKRITCRVVMRLLFVNRIA